jgi:hypothetical protein
MKIIRAIRAFLEKSGAEAEDHRTASPGPSQTMQNAHGLDAHAGSLKHLESTVYDMAVRVTQSDMLRNLEDFIVTLKRVALAGHGRRNRRGPGRTRVQLCAYSH